MGLFAEYNERETTMNENKTGIWKEIQDDQIKKIWNCPHCGKMKHTDQQDVKPPCCADCHNAEMSCTNSLVLEPCSELGKLTYELKEWIWIESEYKTVISQIVKNVSKIPFDNWKKMDEKAKKLTTKILLTGYVNDNIFWGRWVYGGTWQEDGWYMFPNKCIKLDNPTHYVVTNEGITNEIERSTH